jgi:dephospho-CoA kinase
VLAVGLTGGIGSGKSAVAERLVARGAQLIDADQVARDVVQPGRPAHAALVERFGPAVLDGTGAIDRPALARVAFEDPEALRALNDITHPAIGAEMRARRRALEAGGGDGVVVVAIPLLTAAHRTTAELDLVVVVDCPIAVALERLVTERGMDRGDAQRRIAAQVTREERRREADYVLDNGGSLEDLDLAVEELWRWLGARRARTDQGAGTEAGPAG